MLAREEADVQVQQMVKNANRIKLIARLRVVLERSLVNARMIYEILSHLLSTKPTRQTQKSKPPPATSSSTM